MQFININNIDSLEYIKKIIDNDLDIQEFLHKYQLLDYIILKKQHTNFVDMIPFRIINDYILLTDDKHANELNNIIAITNNFNLNTEKINDNNMNNILSNENLNNNIYIFCKLNDNNIYDRFLINI